MSSNSRKSQAIAIADSIMIGDISLSKDKNILKGTQKMHILQKDKSLKNNSVSKDKRLPSGDNSPSNDKLLPKGENSDDIIFLPEEKTENTTIYSIRENTAQTENSDDIIYLI